MCSVSYETVCHESVLRQAISQSRASFAEFMLGDKNYKTNHQTAIQALFNDILFIHTGFAAIKSSVF